MGKEMTLMDCVMALEARRQSLCEEMRAYGSPVPACDVDFNAMVMERDEITAALTRLRPLARGEAFIPHPRH